MYLGMLGMHLGMLLIKQNELFKLLLQRLNLVNHPNPLLLILVNLPILVMGQLVQ